MLMSPLALRHEGMSSLCYTMDTEYADASASTQAIPGTMSTSMSTVWHLVWTAAPQITLLCMRCHPRR
jgi:hypothetical protein